MALSFFIALMSVGCFYLGLRVGQGYKPTHEAKQSLQRIFRHRAQEPPESLKGMIIHENIENYGTKKPQKDVI